MCSRSSLKAIKYSSRLLGVRWLQHSIGAHIFSAFWMNSIDKHNAYCCRCCRHRRRRRHTIFAVNSHQWTSPIHTHTHAKVVLVFNMQRETHECHIPSLVHLCPWYVNRTSSAMARSLACNVSNAKLFPRKFNASGNRHMQTQNASTITYLFILWGLRDTASLCSHTLPVAVIRAAPLAAGTCNWIVVWLCILYTNCIQ